MNVVGIIPARMASSRFPGKPLAKICGMPMIGHVYARARRCEILDSVYIATCDRQIADYCRSIGTEAVMTSVSHQRACDRTAEAMLKIERKTKERVDIAVMIQGDEPLIRPGMIKSAVKPLLKDKHITVTNLMALLSSPEEWEDSNVVKTVVDNENFALYFSREPIPSGKKWKGPVRAYKQIAIIPFRRDFLLKFLSLKPAYLEKIESVDMLRFLEQGYKIKMVEVKPPTYSVDTPEDLKKVRKMMRKDSWFKRYAELV